MRAYLCVYVYVYVYVCARTELFVRTCPRDLYGLSVLCDEETANGQRHNGGLTLTLPVILTLILNPNSKS